MAVVFECDRCQARFTAAGMDERQTIHKLSVDADKGPSSQYRWLLCLDCLDAVERFINERQERPRRAK